MTSQNWCFHTLTVCSILLAKNQSSFAFDKQHLKQIQATSVPDTASSGAVGIFGGGRDPDFVIVDYNLRFSLFLPNDRVSRI